MIFIDEKILKKTNGKECNLFMEISHHNKIGIVTFFENNYGSALQCYATASLITKYGFQPEILSLKESKFFRKIKKLIQITFSKKYRNFYFEKLKINKNVIPPLNEISRQEIHLFIINSFIISSYTKSNLKKIGTNNSYSAFIVGSDQVWNLTWPDINGFWFLDFCPNNKKIAFAPSCGTSDDKAYNLKYFKRINKFEKISLRECNSKRIFEKYYKGEINLICDPTIMFSKEEWFNMLNLEVKKENFIFIHFLNDISHSALNFLNNMSTELGLPIITVGYNQPSFKGLRNLKFVEGGPKEYLEYLANGKIIFTDSFHTTIFSINFAKNFYVFERNYNSEHNQNLRIIDLLTRFNLKERFLTTFDDIHFSFPNFDFSILEFERERTKRYLIEVLRRLKDE